MIFVLTLKLTILIWFVYSKSEFSFLFKSNYVFNEYYTFEIDKSIQAESKNIIKHIFNEEKKEFFTIAYDESKNHCIIYHNILDTNLNEWTFNKIHLDLELLGITSENLTARDHLGMTSKNNLIVIIKNPWIFYVDFKRNTIIFKSDLGNAQTSVDLSTRFEFEPVQNTNDLIGLDRIFKKLVYLNLFIDENSSPISIKLKLFLNYNDDFDITQIKVKKNFLLALQKNSYKIIVYDLNKIKQTGSFSNETILFKNSFYDKNIFFEMNLYCNYLIIFQNPRRLLVYRISDFTLIADVPLLLRVKEIVANQRFITLILSNNDLLTLMIVDHKKDPEWATNQTNSLNLR